MTLKTFATATALLTGMATSSFAETNKDTTPITQSIKDDIMRVDGNEFIRFDSVIETCITGERLSHLSEMYDSVAKANSMNKTVPYRIEGAQTGIYQFRRLNR